MDGEYKIALGVDFSTGDIELDNIKSKIDSLSSNVKSVKIKLDISNVRSQIDSLRKQIESLGNVRINVGTNNLFGNSQGDIKIIKEQNQAFRELYTIAKQMDNLELKLGRLQGNGNTTQIEVLRNQLEGLRTEYQNLMQMTSGQLSTEQLTDLGNSFAITQDKLEQLNAAYRDVQLEIAQGIQTNIGNGTLGTQIQTLETKMQILGQDSDVVSQHIRTLQDLMHNMDGNDDIESVIDDYEQFKQTLISANNEVKKLQNQQKIDKADFSLSNARVALNSEIDVWLKKNTAAAKQFEAEINKIKIQIESADKLKLNNLQAQWKELKQQAQLAGKTGLTIGDKFKSQMSKLGTYVSAITLITQGIQAVRAMYENVLSVDTAMTELYRVTDLTSNQYSSLYDRMTESAKKYKTVLSDTINSTASWVRLNFDSDTAVKLAGITAQYQHVTDLDNETAVKNLITAYKGYQEQLLDLTGGDSAKAVEYISDIYDKLGNEMPVTAAQVGEGMTKCASVMEMAGASIQEVSGMITGGGSVTQDFDAFGNALKISTLRMRGMKGELQELGEDVDENVESISKMQTQILNLTHGKVNIFDDSGNYRNITDVYRDIAKVKDDMSETDYADLIETIAGKHQANKIQAMLNNWNDVELAIEKASNAEGTAAAEQEKYANSMQGKLDNLTTSWQILSNTVMNSEFVKGLIDFLSGTLNGLNSLTDTLGSIPVLITGISVALSAIKNVGGNKMFFLIVEYADSYRFLLDITVFK